MNRLVWQGRGWLLALSLAGSLACTPLESDDTRARQALASLSETGWEVLLPGGARIEVPPGRIEGMAVTAVPRERGELVASGRISLEGRLDGIPFSYLGDERFLVSCKGRCGIEGSPAPELEQVLQRLRERRRALEADDVVALAALATEEGKREITEGDPATSRSRGARAWFIRVDREVALVGEAGGEGEQRKLVLRKEGADWRFVSGLP